MALLSAPRLCSPKGTTGGGLPAPGTGIESVRRHGQSQNCHRQGRALLSSAGSQVSRAASCPARCSWLRTVALHADLANKFPSRGGFPHPCRAPRGGGMAGGEGYWGADPQNPVPHPIDPPEQPAQLLPAWLHGSERVYCSPCPPQSKQQKQSCLPHTTPPRDAANKQKSNLSSQTLQEQGEGRRYPPNPPPPFFFTPGDAGRCSPPCLPPVPHLPTPPPEHSCPGGGHS